MEHLSEHELVLQAQQGNRQAFAALVDCYWPRVFRWLFGLTHNTHTAEELTQDTFLKAWAALGSLTGGTGFRAWLFRIASNGLTDSRRGPRGKPVRGLPEGVASRDRGPVAAVLSQESLTIVSDACARLPPHFRAPFLLRTFEDLSFAEIADALGVTEETVRWRVFKARQLLLEELGHYLDRKSP